MRRRKAAGPANRKVRKPRRVDQLASKINTDAIPDIVVMQSVYGGEPFRCLGFIYSRGRDGYEGFDRDTRSLRSVRHHEGRGRCRHPRRGRRIMKRAKNTAGRTASRHSGDGVLRSIIEAACKAAGVAQQALTVLAIKNDPYRLDTGTHHRNGRWLAEQLERFYGPTKKAHWRGLYYALIMSKAKIKKPDGTKFSNTDEDWVWLSEKAGKAARWLGYVEFQRIIDRRNNEPIIHRAERVESYSEARSDLEDVNFPDDIMPAPAVAGFEVRQAFAFACFGEKSSLDEICLPWAKEHQADLYLGPGETSDTFVDRIARDAVADGRPLVVFALTDCDPSGWQMVISIARKLQAIHDLQFPTLDWEIVHVGLKPEHVREFDLAEEPIKEGDKRAEDWEEAFGVEQTEIDALTTPEMTERGILRRLLDDAIAPYLDHSLERRVRLAKNKWYRDANAALDAQIDADAVEQVRSKIEQLQLELDEAKDELREAVEHIELPDVEVPQAEVDIDSLDDERQAVIKFGADWVTATKILIARKQYLDDEEP